MSEQPHKDKQFAPDQPTLGDEVAQVGPRPDPVIEQDKQGAMKEPNEHQRHREAWGELDKIRAAMLRLCKLAGHEYRMASTITGGLITTVRYLVKELRL
jgi:hypothetical protein